MRRRNDRGFDVTDENETLDPAEGASDDGSPAADANAPAGAADPFAAELAEQRDRYVRLAAEYDNYRKRSMRERAEAESRGEANLMKKLLDPLDDLSRFAHIDTATVDPATVAEGAAMVERKLLKVLSGLGLEVIDPVDQAFDPAVHEAVSTERAKSPEDDHMVAQVFQVGYRHNGQLLRPARVVVKQWSE